MNGVSDELAALARGSSWLTGQKIALNYKTDKQMEAKGEEQVLATTRQWFRGKSS